LQAHVAQVRVVGMLEASDTASLPSHHNFRPGQRNKLVSEPPIAAPDEHAQLVETQVKSAAL
jgi:hypothetical protein